MNARCGCLALLVGLAASLPAPVLAHHSTEVFYDRSRMVEFVGILQRMDMVNPHAWFHFQETLGDGQTRIWSVEADIPSQIRRGILQQFGAPREFETGKKYIVRIEPAWAATHDGDGYLKALIFPDGSVFNCC
jgi:hypothetical protein